MTKECQNLINCGFFKKHGVSKDLSCQGFILKYCTGPKMDQCKRKEYFQQNGTMPPDDMLPNGRILVTGPEDRGEE